MGISAIPGILAFTAGVLGVHVLAALPPLSVLALLAVPALVPWRGRALYSAAAFGVLLTTWQARDALGQRWPVSRHGEDHVVEGFIASLPERDAEAQRFLFEPRDRGYPGTIRVAWYRGDQAVRGGECWRFTLRLRSPHGSLNPGGFDYEAWLFRQHIGATATVRDAQRCAGEAFPILRLRQQVAGRIEALLPDSASAGLLAALTVGDTSGIAATDWELFRRTGTTHLVAISGFNIAIVAGTAFFLCRWAWSLWPPLCLRLPAPRAGLAGSALLAGLYALLAGFEAPVQRAVAMLWIALLALWLHRPARPSRVLALAWLAALLPDPLAIGTPGLWLSFGAVAAIFYVSLGRLQRPGWLHGLVLLQVLIAFALAPLTLLFFQGASWIGPLVNLVAVPFIALLTPCALMAVVLALSWPPAGVPALQACALALDGFHAVLEWAGRAPGLWLPASPPLAALLLALVAYALLFAPRGLPLRPLGALCLLPLLLAGSASPRGGLEVTALDVGQGLAVVVRTAQHTLVYDAGPAFEDGFDAGASVVAPFLLHAGVRSVDLLVQSHGDNDHSGGVPAVRARLNVRAESGTREPCVEGTRWTWDGVAFEILNGPAPGLSDNDGGCVLRVRGPRLSLLLPADIEAGTEERLVAAYGTQLHADVLLTPHHGSRTSSTPAFVAAVHPAVVIHSAGWRHHFRHPRPEVVARYAALGADQRITGTGGAVSVWRDPESGRLEVREFRREAGHWWNAPAAP